MKRWKYPVWVSSLQFVSLYENRTRKRIIRITVRYNHQGFNEQEKNLNYYESFLITAFGRWAYSSSSQHRLHKSRSKADQIKRMEEKGRDRDYSRREKSSEVINSKGILASNGSRTWDSDTTSRNKPGDLWGQLSWDSYVRLCRNCLILRKPVQRVRWKATDRTLPSFYGRHEKEESRKCTYALQADASLTNRGQVTGYEWAFTRGNVLHKYYGNPYPRLACGRTIFEDTPWLVRNTFCECIPRNELITVAEGTNYRDRSVTF